MDKMKLVEQGGVKKEVPQFNVGDTLRILTKIVEGPDKVRLHPFEGVVIAKHGSGVQQNFTIRKISHGEGVERVFPLHSPNIERIEITRSSKVKRAKLYYLRDKIGKRATKLESREEEA